MWTYRATLEVDDGLGDGVADAVGKACPGASMVRHEMVGDATYAMFLIRTHETLNSVSARLHGVEGVKILHVSRHSSGWPYRLKTRAFWVLAAMAAAWAAFAAVGLFVPDSPLLLLDQAQAFVIQTSFTVALAALLYARERDDTDRIMGGIGGVRALADEINEGVRALAERIR